MKSKHFDLVLSEYKQIEDEFLPSNMLIMKSTAIQLAEDACGYSLDDAREALLTALEIDPENSEVLMELGYFYYAVDDNPKESFSFFEGAIKASRKIFRDSIVGGANAKFELGLKAEAKSIACIAAGLANDIKIQELLDLINNE